MTSARTKISPSRKLWSFIEMLAHRRQMTDADLAALTHVCERTVKRDRADPDMIPLERLMRYLSLGLSGNEIMKAIEVAFAEKEEE
ncbi:MAG: hypothetical protein MJ062_05660 [Oscillospiraceae bacterium]|nr:hypothetical protein [Oscillospiraceae bacterium]